MKIKFMILTAFIIASFNCIAQDYRDSIADDRSECVFRYQEPLIGFYEEADLIIGSGENIIDIPAGRVGAGDSWITMHECDHKNWHCLVGIGAPLFIPKPFKNSSEWRNDGHFYRFGSFFDLNIRQKLSARPLFVYSKEGHNFSDIESIYFFDKKMNLIGYTDEISRMENGGFLLGSAWLNSKRAPLDCY